ncbi:PARP10_14_15 [Mytilus coruscus]|uniref:PARP10_14_15 n=1 Tax=Mytilus coruscus TaxID=42192 RepID=A0A6J8C7X4_MYTCO|nr:PARP10_14_15 [Mytilus coruscus]
MEWKSLQTDVQIMTEEIEQPFICPRRIQSFNHDTFRRAVIEEFDNQFKMGETVGNIENITTEFEEKLKLLEAKLTTSKEDNYKAEKVQENMKKQLSIAIDQCNRDGVLIRYRNPNEKKANLQTVFKSKMDFIRSLSSSTIACHSKISDKKFYEIQSAVSNTKDIYCDLSDNKDMITLYASNYEKMGKGKHKAEVALGLRQQSKGRRNRMLKTDTDYSSFKKKPTLVSGAEQTVKRPADFSRSLAASSGPRIEMTFKSSEGIIVKVYNGNILSLDVDCIVNAANENLNHGGGVAYVIAAAAGYDFEKESDDFILQNGPIKAGSCCTTSAGKLKYKCVIHTNGPKWYNYNDKAECCRVLRKFVECCFFEAELNGMTSLATPSISAGIFDVPKEVCCREYGKAVQDFSR